jgi:hypothetical protein
MLEMRHYGTASLMCLPHLRRASERSWSWDRIACRFWPVELKLDPWVSRFVCTWEADCCRTGTTAPCHIDLSTFHVELSTRVVGGSVKSNELSAEQVSGMTLVSQWIRSVNREPILRVRRKDNSLSTGNARR